MANDTLEQLKIAVYTLLRANTALQAQIGNPARVYDEAPTQPVYPFVMVGDAESENNGTRDGVIHFVTLPIHSFSNTHRGRDKVLKISGLVQDALHDIDFAITNGHLISCQYATSKTQQLEDGLTWESITTFKIIAE